MARLPRFCPAGVPVHIIQRSVDRRACFGRNEDFAAYAHWLEEIAKAEQVAIHAWVFMTNHVHLLATPKTDNGISRMMQKLGRLYVRYFNYSYTRTGTLWEGRFKSCVVDAENYFLTCSRYIELNPVRAGMVEQPENYPWSSYGANALGRAAKLWSPHEVYLRLGDSNASRTKHYRELFVGRIDSKDIKAIRAATAKGLALGSDRFVEQLEQLSGRRLRAKKTGPKKR